MGVCADHGIVDGIPNTARVNGGIAVFAQNVPEPGTGPLASSALVGLSGTTFWSRRFS